MSSKAFSGKKTPVLLLLVVGFSLKLTVAVTFTLILVEFGLELTGACRSALATVEGPAEAAVDRQAIILLWD